MLWPQYKQLISVRELNHRIGMINSNSQRPGFYSQLLHLPGLNQDQITQLAMHQDHAVWRSLLKISASNLISDHDPAITQLKLALSQISSFNRNSISEHNEKIYCKVIVCVLSALHNRLYARRRFKQAMEYFKQLCQNINDLPILQQALYNLFGFNSLLALKYYDLHSNGEFKYSKDDQVHFFYILGKIKLSSGKLNQAKAAFEKILMLSKSMKVSDYLMIRVMEYLTQMDPPRYSEQKGKVMESMVKEVVFFAEQKANSEFIIKTLLKLQQEMRRKYEKQQGSGITKVMLHGYLKTVMSVNANSQIGLEESYVKQLLQTIATQSNPTILHQLAHQFNIEGVVTSYYKEKFNRLKLICLAYYYRKMFNLSQTEISKNTISKLSFKDSKEQKKLKTKKKPVDRCIPADIQRAKQILKKCIAGATIIKVNYGNSSVAERYLKIGEKGLVWGSSKDEVEESSSSCKWKHVLGVVYGKASPNLAKDKFAHLQPWRCFSLLTRDRSFDFYCENQSDVFFWLQGISFQLQLFHGNSTKFPFYSKGRALWKMAFLKMASKYLDPKKKYKIKNLGAVLEFRKAKFP